MKLWVPAVDEIVPDEMLLAIRIFNDICYLVRKEVHIDNTLKELVYGYREVSSIQGDLPNY